MEKKKKMKINFAKLLVTIVLVIFIIVALEFLANKVNNNKENSNADVSNSKIDNTKENITKLAKKYIIDMTHSKEDTKFEKVVNNDFTLYFTKVISGENEYWQVSVNGGTTFYDEYAEFLEHIMYETNEYGEITGVPTEDKYPKITVYTCGNYLFYTNHDFTDIRSERIFVIGKDGNLAKEIYELDKENNGLVLDKFEFKDKSLIVDATRLNHGPSIVTKENDFGVEVTSEELQNLPANLIVKATFEYKFKEDGTIDFDNPEIVKTTTLLEYLKEDRENLDFAKDNVDKYISANSN